MGTGIPANLGPANLKKLKKDASSVCPNCSTVERTPLQGGLQEMRLLFELF